MRHASLRENKTVTFDPADFTISHREKIEWMLETNGWALEAVRPSVDDAQATPAHAYSIGVTALTGFPEILVVGLAPATANDVISVAVDALKGGTDIPTGCELVGLLDGEQNAEMILSGTAEQNSYWNDQKGTWSSLEFHFEIEV